MAHCMTTALLPMQLHRFGARLMPENRATRWDPQPPPGVTSDTRGCSQSGSGVARAACSGVCSMAAEVGTTCPYAILNLLGSPGVQLAVCAPILPGGKGTISQRVAIQSFMLCGMQQRASASYGCFRIGTQPEHN